jgi:curved DNA-binding protein CbpA
MTGFDVDPSAPDDDHYAVLGVAVDVSDDELRRTWRQLALEHHPDRAGAAASPRFQRIVAAYTVLSDPLLRASYDRRRGIVRRAPEPPPEPPLRKRAPGVLLQRLSGPLQGLLARGIAREVDGDVIELFLDASEVEEGGMVTISMRVPVHAPGGGIVDELYSAWLAVPPGVTDGAVLTPSARLRGQVRPVSFRVRVGAE